MTTPPQTYPYSISSFADANSHIPPLGDLDINQAIMAGTPVDEDNLQNAEMLVKKIQYRCDTAVPGVTQKVVQSAQFRYEAVRGGHIAAQYIPDLSAAFTQHFDRLQDSLERSMDKKLGEGMDSLGKRMDSLGEGMDSLGKRMDKIEESLSEDRKNLRESNARTNAMLNNKRVRNQNRKHMEYPKLLQKTVLGRGTYHVQSIMKPTEYQVALFPEPQTFGDLPLMHPSFKVYSCTKQDIAGLMYFYNETFGITSQDDDLDIQRFKFIKWLTSD